MFANKKDINSFDGVFLTQLAFELRQLYVLDLNKSNEAVLRRSEELLANIVNIMDTFYTNIGE